MDLLFIMLKGPIVCYAKKALLIAILNVYLIY